MTQQDPLTKQDQPKRDPQPTAYPGSRRERRARRFAEMWNADERVSDADVAAYIASGQAAADQRAGREAWAEHEFDLRQKAATTTRRPRRPGARGAERPAGRRGARRDSSGDDSDSDPSDDGPGEHARVGALVGAWGTGA